MQKNLIFLSFLFLLFLGNLTHGRSYPVKEITGKLCEDFTQECTIPLPKIENANYLNYQHNPLYRRIYTVLRGGTYFGGRDFGLGAHKGVDIASKLGTAIYTIGSGEVIVAESRGDRGKVITIKHQIWKRFLYSNYAHLEEILVKKGDRVQEAQLIAKMGNTGNSTGPHLHFQIDINEGKHPYHPGGCGGETLTQIVNEARCRKQIQANTLDPILFLETQGKLFLSEENKSWLSDQYFLSPLAINFHLDFPVVKDQKTRTLTISPKTITSGFLKDPLKIQSKKNLISLFPDAIIFLDANRKVIIRGEKNWLDSILITSDWKLIQEIPIFIIDDVLIQKLEEKPLTPVLQEILQKL